MNQDAYAQKAELKRKLAQDNGIDLIGIQPNDDWEVVLSRELT